MLPHCLGLYWRPTWLALASVSLLVLVYSIGFLQCPAVATSKEFLNTTFVGPSININDVNQFFLTFLPLPLIKNNIFLLLETFLFFCNFRQCLRCEIWRYFRHRGRNTRGENWMLWKVQSKESAVFRTFSNNFLSFFRQLPLYLSQNWSSDGHFEMLNRSVS